MAWLIVVGEREGLRWVIEHERMAFRDHARGKPAADDAFAMYVSRGAFHNPGRDEAQILAVGRFLGPIEDRSCVVGEEAYGRSAALEFGRVLPEREGLPFKPLVESLSFIKKKSGWPAYVRQALVPLPDQDFKLIQRRFEKFATSSSR